MILITLILYIVLSIYIGYFPTGNEVYYFLAQCNEALLSSIIVQSLKDGASKAIAMGLLILTSFEIIDEVLGKNTSIQINDYIGLILGAITTIYYYRKWNSSKAK